MFSILYRYTYFSTSKKMSTFDFKKSFSHPVSFGIIYFLLFRNNKKDLVERLWSVINSKFWYDSRLRCDMVDLYYTLYGR